MKEDRHNNDNNDNNNGNNDGDKEEEPKELDRETVEADTVHPEYGIFGRARPLGRTFASFYHRDYVYMWSGSLLSNVGTWMQMVAVSWVVFILTKSALSLGFVNFLSSLPVFLFSLYAGSLADRYNRRKLLLIAQAALLVIALALGILSSLNRLTVNWIYFLTLATGVGTAFTFPTWQAMIPQIVPRRDLMNAIALSSAQFNGARMVGPAIAGIVIAAYGAATNFYINAVSFLAVIFALLLIRPRETAPGPVENGWLHFTEGIRYSIAHFSIGVLLVYIGIMTLFGLPFIVLLPIYANEILGVGARGYGFLAGASGLGSLAGALTIAAVAHRANRPRFVKWSILAFGLLLILFSVSRVYYLSLLFLAGAGWALLAGTSTINTMIQEAVPNEIRGRIMSIYVWMFLGLQPFGSLAFGAIAHATQPPVPIIIGGIVLIFASLLVFAKPDLLERV